MLNWATTKTSVRHGWIDQTHYYSSRGSFAVAHFSAKLTRALQRTDPIQTHFLHFQPPLFQSHSNYFLNHPMYRLHSSPQVGWELSCGKWSSDHCYSTAELTEEREHSSILGPLGGTHPVKCFLQLHRL